ncbi:MAG: bifunctional 4-hydroxy-2-oxoglutarate aldolase/2-dehydro-3-deoxy-phosphogluconate aldolase [Acutalibacter sp.]|jgi:2-dehydro-3-deoxyphosphogluconate aldolase/(4S)-4-hydroxy-2-oxoglutarate aldolase
MMLESRSKTAPAFFHEILFEVCKMEKELELLSAIGVVPTIEIEDAQKAVPLAKALMAGGLPVAEVTFRTSAAPESIRRISQECPEVLIGAGTVLTCQQVDQALEAGSKFLVTPGFHPHVIRYALAKGALVIPGTATPGEMEQAMGMGLNVVKFFPAEQNGGTAALKALAGPYKQLRWLPTGGINIGNLNEYLSCAQVLACGGSWMVKRELIQSEAWNEITALCKETLRTMLGFRVVHVGMNCRSADEAEHIARLFCRLFDVPYLPNETAVFAGSLVECIKGPYLGAHGHIAIGTNNVDRAVYHLEQRGVAFEEASRKTDAQGRTTLIYMKEEIGGFALHLVKNTP